MWITIGAPKPMELWQFTAAPGSAPGIFKYLASPFILKGLASVSKCRFEAKGTCRDVGTVRAAVHMALLDRIVPGNPSLWMGRSCCTVTHRGNILTWMAFIPMNVGFIPTMWVGFFFFFGLSAYFKYLGMNIQVKEKLLFHILSQFQWIRASCLISSAWSCSNA